MSHTLSLEKKQTILIVDDTPDNLMLLSVLLKDQYKLKIATNGAKALQIAATVPGPDLILLDVMMPELDGYETCLRLKADPATADIPVIFLTARIQPGDEEMGLNLGAVDYITKPISPAIVMARVATQLNLKNACQLLRDQNRHLKYLGGSNDFLRIAREIAYSHQEKWDGSGYPAGLKDKDIPLSARLMAVADVYDALISKRVYKPPLTHEQAVAVMREGRGTHFDPDILDAFLEIAALFASIAQQFRDDDETL